MRSHSTLLAAALITAAACVDDGTARTLRNIEPSLLAYPQQPRHPEAPDPIEGTRFIWPAAATPTPQGNANQTEQAEADTPDMHVLRRGVGWTGFLASVLDQSWTANMVSALLFVVSFVVLQKPSKRQARIAATYDDMLQRNPVLLALSVVGIHFLFCVNYTTRALILKNTQNPNIYKTLFHLGMTVASFELCAKLATAAEGSASARDTASSIVPGWHELEAIMFIKLLSDLLQPFIFDIIDWLASSAHSSAPLNARRAVRQATALLAADAADDTGHPLTE